MTFYAIVTMSGILKTSRMKPQRSTELIGDLNDALTRMVKS